MFTFKHVYTLVRFLNVRVVAHSRQTMLVKLDATLGSGELLYQPGDHVAIFSENSPHLVDAILMRLHNAPPPDQLIKIEFMHERSTPVGKTILWFPVKLRGLVRSE